MTNWYERKFDLLPRQNIMPSIIERLEGTVARIREKLKNVDPSLYWVQLDGKWSILEQVGHLADLEPFWQVRLQDILSQQNELIPIDAENRRTTFGYHNSKELPALLDRFYQLRSRTISTLRCLTDEEVFCSVMSSDTKIPVRVLDLFFFVAEHDDHHLARISAIVGALSNHSIIR